MIHPNSPINPSYLVVYFFLFLLTRSALIVAPVVRFVDEYGGPARESLAARLAGLFVVVREDCRNAWHSVSSQLRDCLCLLARTRTSRSTAPPPVTGGHLPVAPCHSRSAPPTWCGEMCPMGLRWASGRWPVLVVVGGHVPQAQKYCCPRQIPSNGQTGRFGVGPNKARDAHSGHAAPSLLFRLFGFGAGRPSVQETTCDLYPSKLRKPGYFGRNGRL
jgi:hypothetical protein